MRHAEIECRLLAAPDRITLLFALSQFGHLKSPLFGTVHAQAHRRSAIPEQVVAGTPFALVQLVGQLAVGVNYVNQADDPGAG